MPWSLKQRVLLTLFGVGALVLAIIVFVRNTNVDVDLLAVGLLIAGLAMIVVALPSNGNSAKR